VLNAKGGEIKDKATGSTTTCANFKILVLVYLIFFIKNPLTAKTALLWGRKFDDGKKGEFSDS
jgi:hypothetical protein